MNIKHFILLVIMEIAVGIITIIFLGFVFVDPATNVNIAVKIMITALLAFFFGRLDGIRREKIRQAQANVNEKKWRGKEV